VINGRWNHDEEKNQAIETFFHKLAFWLNLCFDNILNRKTSQNQTKWTIIPIAIVNVIKINKLGLIQF